MSSIRLKAAHAVTALLILLTLPGAHGAAPPGESPRPGRPSKEHVIVEISLLHAFRPVAEETRASVVRLEVGETAVALGAVVGTNGLVLTKASEVTGRELTCRLADGKRVSARLLLSDDETDLALVQIQADHLTPIDWETGPVKVGQWAVTPGTGHDPDAVGIVSATPRRIRPKPAMLGIQLDRNSPAAVIDWLLPGMGAEKAGLKAGDVILTVNEVLIPNRDGLIDTIQRYREGQSVRVRVRRGAQEFEKDIVLQTNAPEAPSQRRQARMNRFGGELSRRAEDFEMAVQHDTVLQPEECGGPLVNLDGKAIGLNIARAGRIASYALPAELVVHTLDMLKQQIATPASTPAEPRRF